MRRAYDLLRGYVNREWDRIRDIDLDKAWQELHEAVPSKSKQEAGPATEQEPTPADVDPKVLARSVLGVHEDATFEDIKRAFDRLNKRSDPSNFPEGSDEASNAAKIQARINWAFRTLIEDTDETEKRFKSLEID
ncbi:MAG: J domain-containing protein [Armatimonadetes bacterium]|nr:J domain-containing protein [Armatimonadota bacterium]